MTVMRSRSQPTSPTMRKRHPGTLPALRKNRLAPVQETSEDDEPFGPCITKPFKRVRVRPDADDDGMEASRDKGVRLTPPLGVAMKSICTLRSPSPLTSVTAAQPPVPVLHDHHKPSACLPLNSQPPASTSKGGSIVLSRLPPPARGDFAPPTPSSRVASLLPQSRASGNAPRIVNDPFLITSPKKAVAGEQQTPSSRRWEDSLDLRGEAYSWPEITTTSLCILERRVRTRSGLAGG